MSDDHLGVLCSLFQSLEQIKCHLQKVYCTSTGTCVSSIPLASISLQAHFLHDALLFQVIARMLESIYQRWNGLPQQLVIVQDNTARECKNQKILKFVTKMPSCICLRKNDIIIIAHQSFHDP